MNFRFKLGRAMLIRPYPYVTDEAAYEATRNPSPLNLLHALDLRQPCRYGLDFYGIPQQDY